jgi:hypothetical protein
MTEGRNEGREGGRKGGRNEDGRKTKEGGKDSRNEIRKVGR